MKIKTWGKFFICKQFKTKDVELQTIRNEKVYIICFGFHSNLEKYINKVLCFTFSY